MTKFLDYVNESGGLDRYNKYFNNPGNHKVRYNANAKSAILYDLDFNKSLIVNPQEDIYVTGDNHIKKGKEILVKIQYKTNYYYINVNKIHTPGEKNKTESLGIQTSAILKSMASTKIDYHDKLVSGWLFKSANELSQTCIRGFKSIKTVPDYLKTFLSSYLSNGVFSTINWTDDITHVEKNQLGVYFGEILSGLCLLSNTNNVFKGLPSVIKNNNVTGVFFPDDPSFKGVDSLVELNNNMYVGISNKKSGGASASLFGNCMERLINTSQTKSNELNHIINLSIGKNLKRDVLSILYQWAFHPKTNYLYKYIVNPYITNPLQIKNDIKKGNINDIILQLCHNISKNYNLTSKVEKNLPNSLSYIITHEMANRLNNDKNALEAISLILAAKDYYQFDLNGKKFNEGNVEYNVKHTGSSKIKILGSRAVSNDIDISQSKVTYQIY